MRLLTTLLLSSLALIASADNPKALISTSQGDIVIELFAEQAPLSVANFSRYAEEGYYDGTIFHRVIPRFMIQGGGFTSDHQRKSTRAPVRNEADNGLGNERGTLAMARTQDPHSATSQFFINTVNNHNLNHSSKSPRGWGYAVFARVIEGMDTVDAISGVATGTIPLSGHPAPDVPREPVIIEYVRLLDSTADEPTEASTEESATDTNDDQD